MFTFDSRIRFSEVGMDRKLSPESLIDYFQDCSTFQSEELGVGFDYLDSMHCAWIINYWEIEIRRRPRLGERVRIGTLPYKMQGFMGLRNFWMETEGGDSLSVANSVWTLLDMQKQYPVRTRKKHRCFHKQRSDYCGKIGAKCEREAVIKSRRGIECHGLKLIPGWESSFFNHPHDKTASDKFVGALINRQKQRTCYANAEDQHDNRIFYCR